MITHAFNQNTLHSVMEWTIGKIKKAIIVIVKFIPWLFVPIFFRIGMFISPAFMEKLNNISGKRTYSDLKKLEPFLGTTAVLQCMFKKKIRNAFKDADLGSSAPDAPLLNLESGKEVRLLDFMKKDRPLVINFGSCT